MCKHGDTVDLEVPIIDELSHTGKTRIAFKPVDRCIASIIKALNTSGIVTTGCCCGHGAQMGYIILSSGQCLGVFPNRTAMMPFRHRGLQRGADDSDLLEI